MPVIHYRHAFAIWSLYLWHKTYTLLLYESYTHNAQQTTDTHSITWSLYTCYTQQKCISLLPDILNRDALCYIDFIPVNTEKTHIFLHEPYSQYTQRTCILLYELYTHNTQQTRILLCELYTCYTQQIHILLYELYICNTQRILFYEFYTRYTKQIYIYYVNSILIMHNKHLKHLLPKVILKYNI